MSLGQLAFSLKTAHLLLVVLIISLPAVAQTRRQQPKKPPAVKKTASVKDKNSKNNDARTAAARRAEEMRRQANLEAERRRLAAMREAQARKLAFERGLRTSTVGNISKDNIDGEDLEARRAAVAALGDRAGTVVVMEPQTGRILTIVNQDWAIREGFKPCSVIKLVTSVAGLNEELIDDGGNLTRGPMAIGLDDALAYSNNAYFQRVGVNVGNQRMINYARMLGLGEPTGLNAGGETGGRLPFGNSNPRIYSHGDDFQVTPLQLAVMVSALSNGGRIVVPQIPKTSFEKANFRGFYRREIGLPSGVLRRVIPGMVGAASYGTARRGVDPSLGIAGKTGSCIGGGTWVGLFASVAPVQNPKLAVVVITRGQNERGKYAAAVAGSIYNALRARLSERGPKTAPAVRIQPRIDVRKSVEIDDGVTEDTDEVGTERKGRKGTDEQPRNSQAKPENKEIFKTVVITPKREEITRPRIVRQ